MTRQNSKYCHACGEPTVAKAKFCTDCGTRLRSVSESSSKPGHDEIKADKSEKKIQVNDAEEVSANLPLNWYYFIRIMLALGVVFYLVVCVSTVNVAGIVLTLALAVFTYGFYARKFWAWQINFLFIAVNAIGMVYGTTSQVNAGTPRTIAFIWAILLAAWYASASFIYFNKRKYYFNQ